MTTSNEHNNAPAVPQDMRLVPVWLLERVEQSLGSFTSDEGWSQSDMDTMDSVSTMLAATLAPAPAPVTLTESERVKCLVDSGCIGTVKMTYDSGPYEITRTSINSDRLIDSIIAALLEKQVAKLDYESMYCWLTAGKLGDWIWNHVLTDEEKNLGNDIDSVVIAALRAKGGQMMSALDARQHSTIAARGGPHVG